MSRAERKCDEALLDGSRSIVEFGSGGSTVVAMDSSATRIVSVDSDPGRLDRLRGQTRIVHCGRNGLIAAHAFWS